MNHKQEPYGKSVFVCLHSYGSVVQDLTENAVWYSYQRRQEIERFYGFMFQIEKNMGTGDGIYEKTGIIRRFMDHLVDQDFY